MQRFLFPQIGGLLTLCFACFIGVAKAQPSAQSDETGQSRPSLTVGVSHMPPFAIETKTENGRDWDGIGVHLWREVAEDLDIQYEWQMIDPTAINQQVQTGTVDIAITASATADGEQQLDFTQSYYTASIGIAQPRRRRLLDTVIAVLSPRFLWICLWLSVLLLLVGLLVWLFERSSNQEMFGEKPTTGLWNSFWWAGVTLTTIGYGDIAPISVGGRVIALLWMLVSMGLTASLTATITSVVTQDNTNKLTRFADLNAMKVGSLEGSRAAQALQQQDISFEAIATPLAGLQAVDEGRLDAFVYDDALLRYLNQQSLQNRLAIESTSVEARRYVFAMPDNADAFESISAQMLREQSEADWQALLARFSLGGSR